jgi:phosphoglycolate phosphatase
VSKVVGKFKVKAVMIDLDGTLVHTAPEIAQAANHMLSAIGKPRIADEQIQSFIGEGALILIKRCLTHTCATEPDADLLAKAQPLFFEAYSKVVTQSQPYPEVIEALQTIKAAGLKLACITNKPATFTLPLLEHSQLLPYFDLVVSGDTLQRKKPDPDQILHICEHFGIAVNESVLIGDSQTDVEAARNAGCYVFTVPYGYNQGYSMEIGAVDALIDHIGDAVALVAT